MRRTFTLLAIVAILVSVLVVPAAAEPAARSYLIMGKNEKLPSGLTDAVEAAGGTLVRMIPQIGIAVAESGDLGFAAALSEVKGVRSVVPNVSLDWIDPGYRVAFDPAASPPSIGDNEPLYPLQWALDAIDAPEAWNAGALGTGVRVAVLDTGFDLDHPDLAPNINFALSTDFTGEGLQYGLGDVFSHGSHVAGIVAAAANEIGTIGVAPEAELVLVKVLRDAGSGSFDDVIAGIVYAADVDADVINMSLGALVPKHGFLEDLGNEDPSDDYWVGANEVAELLTAIGQATTYAYQQGTTVIASAGNEAVDMDHTADLVHIPSDAPNVMSIAATGPLGIALDPSTDLDVPAFYTNYGLSAIAFAAPGGNVLFDLYPYGPWYYDLVLSVGNGGWFWAAGTSQASPQVAGVAALIIGENGGDMQPAQVEAALLASADDLGKPGKDVYYGLGRVNAGNCVK